MKIQIGYTRIRRQDIIKVLYFIFIIWLFSTKEIGSQSFAFLLILAYPILRFYDRLKGRKTTGIEFRSKEIFPDEPFPTFKKWTSTIKSAFMSFKNKLLHKH